MEAAVQTDRQLKACGASKLYFNGSEEEFNEFYKNISQSQLRSARELDGTIKVKESLKKDPSMQDRMNACCSCRCCKNCPGLLCCINCILLILFFWIICPILCCIGYCIGKAVLDAVTLKNKTYQKIEDIGTKTKLNIINLHLQDLNLSLTKIGCLRELITRSGANYFTLKNGLLSERKGDKSRSGYYKTISTNIVEITRIPGLKYDIDWGKVQERN